MNLVVNRTTWINKVKTLQYVNKALVLRKLNISEEDYNNLWLDGGTHYLRVVLAIDEDTAQDLINSNLYWKWWLNHWHRWDAAFLQTAKITKPKCWTKLYDELHDPSEKGLAPNKKLLKEMLAESVVDKLIAENEI